MIHGSRSKPLLDSWVHHVALLCCCKRTDLVAQNLCFAQTTAEVQTGVLLKIEYLGLENGKVQLLTAWFPVAFPAALLEVRPVR